MKTRIIYQILLFIFFQSTSLMYNSYATTITNEVKQKKQPGKYVTSSKKSSTAKKNVSNESKSDIYISDKPSNLYKEWKNRLIDKGYHIYWEDYADLAEGELVKFSPRLCVGVQYAIIAVPDDSNVQDVNIYIYYSDGRLYDSDDAFGSFAMITYGTSSEENHDMRVVVKNSKSNRPNQKYRCRYMVAYYKNWDD